MGQNVVAISSDFLSAFAVLPRNIQGKVTDFINKFRNNPNSSGINYEKIHNAADDKMCSVRIDDVYRGIVARQESTGVYLMLWVDHHNEAYEWAMRKKCEVNSATGCLQVFDIQQQEPEDAPEIPDSGLFSHVSDSDLLSVGVPEEQLNMIRALQNTDELYKLKNSIPEDAYEGLEWIANGFKTEEVIELLSAGKEEVGPEDDFAAALQNPRSRKTFVIVEGEEELRRVMAEPLEKWRVFLHPAQRKIVQKEFSGPVRILGGAGTGKTVAAMHRAKWIASKLNSKDKILFTTFTANLAGDIKDNLRKICSSDEQKRIEVINLDAWIARFLKERGYSFNIAYDDTLTEVWEKAIALANEDPELTVGFYSEEWSKVVCAQEAFSLEQYLKASRVGRGTRLDRKKRIQVWRVFEEYQNIMRENHLRDVDSAMYECRKILEKTHNDELYSSVIVDEGQDLSTNAFRLLRSLVPEQKNDLYIVGDAHQRIYKNKASLSKCGINIRGRSYYLKINYRTTEEIRKYAFGLLKGIKFDDLDDQYDDGRECQSLTHGTIPVAMNFKTADEEFDHITEQLNDLISNGVNLKDICLVTRTHKLLDSYKDQLAGAGFKTYEIRRSKLDDRNFDGIRIATMHRVKGLEFQHMFIAAVNQRVMPLIPPNGFTDSVAESEALTAEKCLLYVALTRAQKSAVITSYGTKSELLV
jgi:superfamily I DNA/RNA helicase/mRNA-degrading endonuclease RelE of RelBE toxin-antitoxin system